MSLVSFESFALVFISLIVYYIVPIKHRWLVLLAGSLYFYARSGIVITAVMAATAFIAYYGAILIEKDREKSKKILIFSIVLILAVLVCTKYLFGHLISFAHILIPIGISYYSLSLVGYLADVYWKKDSAEHDFLRWLSFVAFFPKILQGPISSHKVTGRNITGENRFVYENVCYGLQRMIWGLFKKLVIADRLGLWVSTVYGDLEGYGNSGAFLIVTMFASAVQLYMDFSGYTDIALGISEMFGITLEENFERPFFSTSAAGFWGRWHMTLSGWFKDYLFLPLSRTSAVKNASRKMGARFGADARKKTMITICSAVVWLATGIWHGAGVNYMVWGLYWGSIIIFSSIFEKQINGISRILHINTDAPTWKLFRMVRTVSIFAFGRMIATQPSLHEVRHIIRAVIKEFHPEHLSYIKYVYLSGYDFVMLAIGLITVLVISILQERGMKVRECIATWNAIPRWIFYAFSLTVVLLVGVYGSGYDTSSFAYQFF
ncbi:MAG: hypothetical protein K6G58_10025 [Lachnospiraceae bacterium]|nr:hypothetical protein [Lachnospiraceae bacterium]